MSETAAKPTRAIEFLSRIGTGEMIGSQKSEVRGRPEGDKEVIPLGVIYGEARGLSYRNNTQNAEEGPAIAIIGVFEFVPYDTSRPLLRSPACFLPKTVHDMAVRAVRGGGEAVTEMPKRGSRVDRLGVKVPLAFDIGARKNDQAVGYEFVTAQLKDMGQEDPMLAIRGEMGIELPDPNLKRIASTATKQISAPAKKPDAKKNKRK